MNENQKTVNPRPLDEIVISDSLFCDGCPYLSVTEVQQDAVRKLDGIMMAHECRWYHSILLHHGQHPRIPKLPECANYVRI